MFDKRYSTRGVVVGIDLDIQLCLWGLIDIWKKRNQKLDFLQIFELSVIEKRGQLLQKVIHFQEEPRMKQEAYFKVIRPINKSLWIVANDEENAVLMFPEEY